MTDKAKAGRGTITIEGERLVTETFSFDGDLYTLRELTTDEGDEAWDAAQEPIDPKKPDAGTKINGRLNTRFLLAKALVEPVTSPERVGKWGGRKYTTVLQVFNRLNSIEDANPTPPAGSAGPTSPAGGESSPTS